MRRLRYLFVLLLIFISQVVVFIGLSGVNEDGGDFDRKPLGDPGNRRNSELLFGAEAVFDVGARGKKDAAPSSDEPLVGHARETPKRSQGFHTKTLEELFASSTENKNELSDDEAVKRWFGMLQNMTDTLFLDEMGPKSDSICQVPDLKAPAQMCRDEIGWECNMVPAFSSYNPSTRNITVKCPGRFRVNQVDRTESEEIVSRGSYRRKAVWKYYQGPQEIAMETEYADVVCKNKKMQDLHNYHTQFVPKPAADRQQEGRLREVKGQEPAWQPLCILTVVLDSMSRAQAHRSCGLPKTMALLKKFYRGYFSDIPPSSGHGPMSHQSFFFSRLNAISSSTLLNLTPLFSGQLYQDIDMGKVARGIYAKDIKEWIWEYAAQRGYITSYGVDNNSGLMGTRTHCKACHYRPPVLPHVEHGWQKRENEQVRPNVLSGLCDGNHMLHEYILNYTRDFLKHPYPAKWAALDLNAGHRGETESGNQVDAELAVFLEDVLKENRDLVVFILGDHGKPLHKNPSHLGSYYETLLPFLSVLMPTWLLRERPDIMANLIDNQQRYMVHADLHLSMKSLLHYPNMGEVDGAIASKAVNVFTEVIPQERSCEQANIPPWTCVCGFMQKLPESHWTPRHTTMVQKTLGYINAMHSLKWLQSSDTSALGDARTSCLDLHLRRILSVVVNENKDEDLHSARHYVYRLTFQTIEEDTVWSVVMDSDMDIKRVRQITLYQPYDVCWDRRVPLQFCVCNKASQPTPSKLYRPRSVT
ncbi:uncharacterized protein LOC110987557 [Acanthaster planci]|uniref:Uncharacterized protein LOC110987557 n=1 Tax=Acanthaster planci TaxID=133434 RepID=A0A8B7ZMF1_ACAPL|nr:uncharacterized protein LOC110987557 [Acanthaster planci]